MIALRLCRLLDMGYMCGHFVREYTHERFVKTIIVVLWLGDCEFAASWCSGDVPLLSYQSEY